MPGVSGRIGRTSKAAWIGLLSACIGAAWIAASPVAAQQERAPLEAVTLRPNVTLIAGAGANVVVQHGVEGVVLIDAGSGARSAELLSMVEALSAEPIRFVINTSAHPDHVGGNGVLAAAGLELGAGNPENFRGRAPDVISGVRSGAARLAHENVLLRMAQLIGGSTPVDEALWPTEGFIDRKDLFLNGEAIQVIHQPAAHSDGDALVFLRQSDVIVAGELIDTTRFPRLDVAAGGTVGGLIAGLNRLLELTVPPTPLVWRPGGTQVVPARGHVLEEADVLEYRDMVTIVRDVVRHYAGMGMTLAEIQAMEPTRGYTSRYGAETGDWTTAMFVEAVYRTMEDAR
jgi:glyoxylase-like metal-dependent hydrolase (beta-lactamase superfamily II)